MDFNDPARTALVDQALAQVRDTAHVASTFYRALIEDGVSEAAATGLTVGYVAMLMQSDGGDDE